MRTYTPKPGDVEKNWYVIDATDVVLGRLAAQAATLLRGKHKPQFAPNEDCGDYVVIINADKVALTNGKADKKFAYRHSGHPGGLTAVSYRELLATRPERAVEKAIKGMVPHTKLGRAQLKKLKVYAGAEHPHASQSPNAPSSYTTETEESAPGRGQSITAPGSGLGRRKEAVARVRLVPGTGQWTLNGRSLEDYFPNKLHQQLVRAPFTILDLEGRFDVIARINGGGVSGQAGALRLGIARALNEIDREANRATLKKAGFLTRDSRIVERKKAGLHKARRAPQYSKR